MEQILQKITSDSQEESKLVHVLLNIGEELLVSGAEIQRVEDTIRRIGTAFGAQYVDVFVITSCIILSMTDADGKDWTHTRRIRKTTSTDFIRLEKVNELSRKCCKEGMSLEELQEGIHSIMHKLPGKEQRIRMYLGSAMAAFGFAIFFGGHFCDGIAGVFGGLMACLLQDHLERYCPNRIVFNLISAFLCGTVICSVARLLPWLQEDSIMIGVIMLQIPGIAMTISFRDIISGETISGSLRLIESVLWAAGLSCGYMLAMLLVNLFVL